MKYKIFFSTVLFFGLFQLSAQLLPPGGDDDCGGGPGCDPPPPAPKTVTVSGPTNVLLNSTHQYNVSTTGGTHYSTSYTITGGSIVSQTKSWVKVKWTSGGNNKKVKATANISGNYYTNTKYSHVLTPGSISATTTTSICQGTNPGKIKNNSSATGSSSSISYQWQYRYDGPTKPSSQNINVWYNSSVTGSEYDPSALNYNITFRRRASSSAGSVYTNTVKYTVTPSTQGGTISSVSTVCGDLSSTVNFNLAGHLGTIYRWQIRSRPVGSSSWSGWSTFEETDNKASVSYNPVASQDTEMQVQAVVKNGICSYQYPKRTITVYGAPAVPSVTLNTGSTVCQGTSVTFTSSGSAYDKWYTTSSGGSAFHTGKTYTKTINSQTTYYVQAYTQHGCTNAARTAKTVNVHGGITPGSISYNGSAVCAGGYAGEITGTAASGGDGTISYYWRRKEESGSWSPPLPNSNSKNYTPVDPINGQTWFQRFAWSGCGENPVPAAELYIDVNPTFQSGTINWQVLQGWEACVDDVLPPINSSGTTQGGESLTYQWMWSEPGANNFTVAPGASTGSSYTPLASNGSKDYKLDVTSCYTQSTNVEEVRVKEPTNAGSIGGPDWVCYNTPFSLVDVLPVSGEPSLTVEYNRRPEGGTTWTSTPMTGITITSATEFQRVVTGCEAAPSESNIILVNAYDALDQGSISAPVGTNYVGQPFTISNNVTGSGGDSQTYVWGLYNETLQQWSPPIAGETGESLTVELIAAGTYTYRRGFSSCGTTLYTPGVDVTVITPTLTASSNQLTSPGTTSTLNATNGYAGYEWYRDDVLVNGQTSSQFVVNAPGTYKVKMLNGSGNSWEYTVVVTSQFDEDRNYILTAVPREAVNYLSSQPAPDTNPTIYEIGSDPLVNMDFYDGLGRKEQSIQFYATPLKADVVTPFVYDEIGRMTKEYLPYPSGDQGAFKNNAINDQVAYYQANYGTSVSYAEVLHEQSPLNRPVEQAAPGEWGLGSGHTIVPDYRYNDGTEVIDWDYENILSQINGKVGANELSKNKTTDEDGNETVQYTNKKGQMVMKESKVGSSWAKTYYVYDQYGQLQVVIPPEASDRLADEFFATGADRQAFLDIWAFQYEYDQRRRMISKQVPGAGEVLMIYDDRDRLVLTQDGNQRLNNQWLFTKYDGRNRPILTGIYMDATPVTTLRANVAAHAVPNEGAGSALKGYTNSAFPVSVTESDLLTVTYYDNHNFTATTYQRPPELNSSDTYHILPENNATVKGQVTGTLTADGKGGFISTVNFYDDKYRVIQTVSDNHLGGIDVISNQYDFAGNLMLTKTSHTAGVETYTILRRFVYDHTGRLLETYHSIDGGPEVLLVSNQYNELGEMIEKDLHAGEQSLDYTYNIRGWLTSINDSGLSDGEGDLFGMELHYNINPLDNTRQYFNGNIGAVSWSNQDNDGAGISTRSFTYDYDKLNRLTDASHYEDNVSVSNYSVYGIGYDQNGNILSLSRNGASGSAIDILDYHENDFVGNQLMRVSDAATDSIGFNDGNTSGFDYSYDANGNMVKDRNKAIDSIYYNHLNLPVLVDFASSGDSIEYQYDAAGIKLQQKVYDEGALVKTTDYVGEFIYENGELQLVQHEEGRIVPKEGTYDYQYHLKDHLGNTRVTFSTTPENYTMTAQFEDATLEQDTVNFSNVDTPNRVPHPSVANTGKAVRLNNTTPAGPLTVISVNKGDTISLSVKAYYEGGTGYSSSIDPTFLETELSGAFNTSQVLAEGGVTSTQIDNGVATAIALLGVGGSNDDNVPGAYLNYMVFDRDMVYQGIAGFVQISSAANLSEEQIALNDILIDREGFLIAYLSNESNSANYVYFDDFEVYHGKTNVVQSDDYYPFGLTFNSSSRTASTVNSFKYNGFEEQKEWGVYDYLARHYDPANGRWMMIDPAADLMRRHSPYNYAFDNPIRYIDPDGMMPTDAIAGALNRIDEMVDYATSYPEGTAAGGSASYKFSDITVEDSEGNLSVVSVTFQNSADGESSNNEVNPTLYSAVVGAVKEAHKESPITSILITSTTNGKHGSKSRHYEKNGSKAVDIGAVNGENVSENASNAVVELQDAFENQSGARENFGPHIMKKSGSDYIHDGLSDDKKAARTKVKNSHKTHIHWSVD